MSIIRLNKADTNQQILGLNGKPIRKNNSLLYKHPDITKSFGINKLKAGQASPFKVQREDNETFDVPFIKSTPDWDAMHTFMNGERAMLRKWNNQADIEGDGEEFEGNDKPEVSQAVEGVCVEKEATNLYHNGTGGAQTIAVTAIPYTLSFEGTGSVELSGTHTATVAASGTRTTYTFTPTAGNLTVTPTDATKIQLEEGSYATLYIPTDDADIARLAPAPVLTDFLPTTGSVAGWVDIVKDNGYLFEGDVSIEIAGDLIIAKVKDQYLFMENPFTWDIYTRKNIGFILSWDATEVIFDISDGDGNLYRITEDKAYSAITDNDITLGNQTSVYWNIIIKHNG